MPMTSAELRALFLKYFESKGHTCVESSSLVPVNDPTLLFTNAGMVQFKDVFLGRESRPYARAVSSQRCVRAGGKHNDLENVGYTARHHTFFEMLGNFSFGDYFKLDAIRFAWEFLTVTLKLPPERLWVTVYDQDKDAEDIWIKKVGVVPARLSRIGSKDNFWSMGDTGPCGPCTEIFYDHGPDIPGGPPGSPEEDGDRYVEIWNLVFMQYDRAADGQLTPLPKPSVDTGMGLERVAAIMQGVHNNYDIDLFKNLIKAAAKLTGAGELGNSSLRVIADHIRSCAFLIVDGVIPSNEGRGYVLRRIIRRAIRHGYKLGIKEPFFFRLVETLCAEMGRAYPELIKAQANVERVLIKEEERFAETLEQGMKILDACIKNLDGDVIPGATAFQLYDTYGFPVDLTADVAREQNLTVDMTGFELAMAAQRERARSAGHFAAKYAGEITLNAHCTFDGYDHLSRESRILALFSGGKAVETLKTGDEGIIVLDTTPFYAESGGQVGDRGMICSDHGIFEVLDTRKQGGDLMLHTGRVTSGAFAKSARCRASVDHELRHATALNHTATHLLHAALRKVLGEHVAQKGSLVNAERLRFDFSHFEPVSLSEIEKIESLVNKQIRSNHPVTAQVMAKDDAMKLGAMALFGEKYGDEVRVLRIGHFSTELCGGTHAERAGDMGFFKIIAETGVAAGVRRIEAITGANAFDWVAESENILRAIGERVKSGREGLDEKIQQLLDKNRQLERELTRLQAKAASSIGTDLASLAEDCGSTRVLVKRLDESEPKGLRELVDQIKNKLGSAVILLASVKDGKVSLIAGVTADQTPRIKAGELINIAAVRVGGKGGGRPDLAQAGGNDPAELDNALDDARAWIRNHLV
ncbi:alanine--tRNA ligase [Candidatus Methylospira mobilis]|nr:alanine--tRNA ligase [Candidatus Methylospira mobilis]WNV06807.1 alanine--tRNA ligase [Candidatus Methylospira mobilis]